MAHPTGARLAVGLVVGLVAVQALMLFVFAWPATNSGPREVPIALAGPPEAVAQVEPALAAVPSRDGGVPAFDVVRVEDQAAATAAISEREVYGAVVLTPEGPQLLVASAGGPAVAQLLRSAVSELSPDGARVLVQDVVPTTADDLTGSGIAAGVLPLVMTSVAGGLAVVLLLRRSAPRLAALAALSVMAGLTSAALLQYGLGVTAGSYWSLVGVLTLLVGAVAASVAGLGAVLGRAGAVLGALTMIFVANPLSAPASAPEMLPQPWGDIGQLMPAGAGVSAIRSVAFFDGAAAGVPLVVLAVWLAAGLALIAIGGVNRTSRLQQATHGEAGSVPDRGTQQARSSASA